MKNIIHFQCRQDPHVQEQGIKVLGCPWSCQFRDYAFEAIARKHQVLLQEIPNVKDVQSAWLLLLHCAAARAIFYLCVVRPDLMVQFAKFVAVHVQDLGDSGDPL